MTNSYTQGSALGRRLRQLGLTALLAGGTALAAQAQTLNYAVAGATNVTTTYTDLGTSGTAITPANTDDANSTAQPIGFTFTYNGTAFTQFTLSTNGFIKLGATAPSSTQLFISETSSTTITDVFESANDPNIIAPFNIDLTAGTSTPEYRVATTGTAPNRICTVQWKNVSDKAATNPTQYTNLSFQVRLYETTGVIELVYGAATVGTTSALRFSQAGLKGTSFAAGQIVQPIKQSTAAWSTATFADYATVVSSNALNTVNIRTVAPPDAGRTFRFTPTAAAATNDAAVSAIYTLGKIITPAGLPHAAQARITNAGSTALTNLAVTLNVTGANTFTDTKTVASLAVGASTTVTFASYPSTLTAGTNTVAVTVPADGNNANNSVTQQQLINTTTQSYIAPDQTTGTSGLGYGTGAGILASKFTTSSPLLITSVSDYIVNTSSTPVGHVMYAVVLSSAGAILGRSADYTITTADVGTNKVLAITTPPTVPVGDYYVGIAQAASTTAFYPVGLQVENPTRTGAFYGFDIAGGTPADAASNNFGRFMIEAISVVPANCVAPTAVTVTNLTSTGATVNFTPATTGVGSYNVIYGPTGFNPTTGGTTVIATGSPATLTGLTPGTTYQVYITSNCTAGGTSSTTTAVAFSTPCPATTTITAFPYTETFDNSGALPCGFTTLDGNADGTTWTISTENPYSGTRDIRYQGAFLNNVVANDWFFTPGLVLAPASATTRYQLAFRYRAYASNGTTYTERLEVKSGTAATVAGQTNTLYTNNGINNLTYALANGTSTPAVAYLPAGASTQFIGFHVISAINQGNLYIDDLNVTAVTVTATTSQALLNAVNVFPNPSTGVFNLDIHGANAKGAMDVLVTNTLGQRVYAGTVRDNYTNQLDLSNLAPGLYHLQVKNGDDTLVRQISVVK